MGEKTNLIKNSLKVGNAAELNGLKKLEAIYSVTNSPGDLKRLTDFKKRIEKPLKERAWTDGLSNLLKKALN
jgi:hypothetical protein